MRGSGDEKDSVAQCEDADTDGMGGWRMCLGRRDGEDRVCDAARRCRHGAVGSVRD